MARAVSNSSPLIHLAAIHRLALLQEFYAEVLIPPAVWREVVDEGQGRPGAAEVAGAARQGWLRVATLNDTKLLRLLLRDLHQGEAEAVALAIEQSPDVLLLDESEARRIAGTYALNKTGVVGLLIRAKCEGQIKSLKAELDRLRRDAGFWIADDLYCRALFAVAE